MMVSPLLGRDPVGVFPIGGRGCDGAEHQSATGKRVLSLIPLWAMQGLGAGRSAATTRALETKGRHRSPTIVVSDLCNVTSLIGHTTNPRGSTSSDPWMVLPIRTHASVSG
jgi:hypothetical protein